jgi:hypothetical protein
MQMKSVHVLLVAGVGIAAGAVGLGVRWWPPAVPDVDMIAVTPVLIAPPRSGDDAIDRALAEDIEALQRYLNQPPGALRVQMLEQLLEGRYPQEELRTIYDEFTGLLDRNWRTPKALAREFVQRLETPASAQLMIARVQAEAIRREAEELGRLAERLKTSPALRALADVVWSDDSIRLIDHRADESVAIRMGAVAWGQRAGQLLEERDPDSACAQMESDAKELVAIHLRRACMALRSPVSAFPSDAMSRVKLGPDTLDGRSVARARLDAQVAATVLGSLAEARLEALLQIEKGLRRVSPARVVAYTDSYTGPLDIAADAISTLSTSVEQVELDRFRQWIEAPAELQTVQSSIDNAYRGVLDNIQLRVVDRCNADGAGDLGTQAVSLRQGSRLDPTKLTPGQLAAGIAIEGAIFAADSVLLATELVLLGTPSPATMIAGAVVIVADCTWQASQVTPTLRRRTEVMSFVEEGMVREWIGGTGRESNVMLEDGTVIARAKPPMGGILGDAEMALWKAIRDNSRGRFK